MTLPIFPRPCPCRYEDFVYGGRVHYCASGPHIIHLFSFSKAYGMMGWRVGYLAYPDFDGDDRVGAQLLKVRWYAGVGSTTRHHHTVMV